MKNIWNDPRSLFNGNHFSSRTKKIFSSYELARPVMGNICLVGERAKRARHSRVCSIENRGYIICYGTCKFCSYNP